MASLLIRPMFPYMRPLCFKTAGISKLLCGLDINKAPGPDGIHPRILRQLNLAIAPTLQVIFEKTYKEGVVPEDWRRANICPIYKKKGARKDPANYRPISLTCIASKLFEHIASTCSYHCRSCLLPGRRMQQRSPTCSLQNVPRSRLSQGSEQRRMMKRSCPNS